MPTSDVGSDVITHRGPVEAESLVDVPAVVVPEAGLVARALRVLAARLAHLRGREIRIVLPGVADVLKRAKK